MAHDDRLAERVHEQLAGVDGVTEKAMFGRLVFLFAGNMAVGLAGDELMVRVGRDGRAGALAEPHTRPADMSGRPMKDWVLVAPAGVETEPQLRAWVRRGLDYAASLPAKG